MLVDCHSGYYIANVLLINLIKLVSFIDTFFMYKVENADVALTDDDKASSYTGTQGVREYLLCIDGNYVDANHTAEPVWKIEVTSPVEEGSEEEPTVVTYTIDFSEMITAIHSAE